MANTAVVIRFSDMILAPITKKLHINEAEAETVKFVFEEYLRTGSAKAVATTLELKGIRGKVWTTKKSVKHDGQKVNNQMIYRMLKNPLYIVTSPKLLNIGCYAGTTQY